MKKYFNIKKGFTLIELILVIGVGLAMSFTAFQSMSHKQEQLKASIVGQQIKNVGEAVNVYVSNHYDALSTLSNSTGTTTDVGPRTCTAASSSCVITTTTLTNEGLLPPTFSGKNAFNSTYTIVLKRSGASPYYTISGLVTTTDPWKGPGNAIRYDWLGTAMQSAGLDSGMTRDIATRVNGYNGQWVVDNTSYSNITQLGQLAYITGYGSNSYSVYLRRDGVLPMTGQLNMNGNDIGNARNITASGTGNFGGNLATNGYSNTDMPTGWEGIRTGDIAATGTFGALKDGTTGSAGQLAAYMNKYGNIYSSNRITTDGFMTAGSYITSGDSITAAKDINAGNWLTAKNGLGNRVRIGGDATGDYDIVFQPSSNGNNIVGFFSEGVSTAFDFSFRRSVSALNTAGTQRGVYLDGNTGQINANSWISAKSGYGDTISIGGDAAGNDYEIRLGTDKPLTIYSPNKASASSIVFQVGGASSLGGDTTVSGNITASGNINGAYIQPNATAVVGGACSSTGLISKDNAGFILSCQSGKWQRQFNPAVTIRNDGVWAKNSDFQACNSDEVVVGGGGECEEPGGHYIHYSAPLNNGWSIDCYQSSSSGTDKGSLAYAICMKK